ncbi:MAG: 6,7-dimethyl-8-ribityllumazine synthase [Bdellovibrionaceae bacterium]|nr:6,7-dimethyl-8-ribityllumazine synthase [Pseudobdellovibrionaceae bacterium]
MNNHIAIICSEFNKKLVESLYKKAEEEFKKNSHFFSAHYPECHLKAIWVPGAGEIPLAVKWLIEKEQKIKTSSRSRSPIKSTKEKSTSPKLLGVLALGVVIKGQTGHYDFLNGFLQKALWDIQKKYPIPSLFSISLLENKEQFQKRIKRAKESMKALIQMIKLKQSFK